MKAIATGLAPIVLLAAAPASAEVLASTDTGFVTQDSATVAATPAEVWDVLVRPSRYWNPAHSFYGDAEQLFITFGPGGCFCEIVEGDEEDRIHDVTFVEHARVINTAPGRLLRLSGALGPLQSEALTGTLSVELEAGAGGSTVITWTYVVAGHARFPLEQVAPAVDGVMSEQLARLVAALERTGHAAGD